MGMYNGGYPGAMNMPGMGYGYPGQQSQQTGLNSVLGEAPAKAFLVEPGCTVDLWDREEKVIYLKTVDAAGLPSMKILDYTIRGEENAKPVPEYVTKEDFDALAEKVKELAAKKKPARVIREDEDDE